MKKTHIDWSNVADIISDHQVIKQKRAKDTLEFLARDFETIHPDVIIVLKEPIIKKGIFRPKIYRKVAIKVDEPQSFKAALNQYFGV